MSETLRFLLVLEVLGLVGLPLAARAFGGLPGAGAGLGRILALLLAGWLFWLCGSLGLGTGTGVLVGCGVVVAGGAVLAHGRRGREPDAFRRRTAIRAELLFVVAFLLAAFVVAHDPGVWGTEKPMDMAIVNAIDASASFPPQDPWLSGFDLNYYYLGQLLLALLIRVTDVEPSAGYNLALATLFALVVSVAFAVVTAFAETARRQGLPVRRPALAGGLAVVLLVLMGNLRGGWDALTSGPLREFDWFGASRVVEGTINEFPAASFAVGDLHAHVIAVPLTLLVLAFALQLVAAPARAAWWSVGCAALATGSLYAVNSWSWPVGVALVGAAVLVTATGEGGRARWRPLALQAAAVVLGGLVLVAPFVLGFEPNAGGLGVVGTGAREPLGAFLEHRAVMEGALLWLVLVPLAALGRRRPAPTALAVGAVVVLALLLGSARLGGAVLLFAVAFAALAAGLATGRRPAERFLWLVTSAGLALLAGPEVLYVRDEFDGTEFTRMNTVFKLGYQGWLLLAVAGAVLVVGGRHWIPARLPRTGWRAVAAVLVAISLAYPAGAIVARTQGLDRAASLEGRLPPPVPPSDRAAIDWLRAEAAPDAVVAEAVGDDYSPQGAARISTFTGRPAVLGWAGHQLQWSHDVGTRREDVATLYRSPDPALVREIAERYRVDYVVVGPLETTTYGLPGAVVALGRPVFRSGATVVYRLT